ncbi:MAG: hypothetical protein H0V65_05105 [Chitinophagales bacterium]|jgi:hypothetical protein|nr:hypothetical protein [Chitinophagales bacterium]
MKKLFFIASVTLAVGFTSCKKDYTCTCTENGTNVGVVGIPNSSKSDAQTLCDNEQTTLNGLGASASCTLD